MRHTEAAWEYGQEDRARQLTEKGKRQALDLAIWLSAQSYHPTQALVSDATRTQQTFLALNQKCPVSALPKLYLAEPEILMLEIQKVETECLLVLAHNPGLAELATKMASESPSHHQFFNYPPGATLVLEYNKKFDKIKVFDFITPDDLPL
jgi:phosphohistidine phosphatase